MNTANGSVVRRTALHVARLSAFSRLVKPLCNMVTMSLPKLELKSPTPQPQTVGTFLVDEITPAYSKTYVVGYIRSRKGDDY
jgi:hypothetical protein